MEAMATGVPCVAPRINGIPELIRDGVDGLLFTVSDVAEMVAATERLMDDTGMRRRMAESSRARVIDKYDLHKNVERLAEVLKNWLEG
jgi:glycosyltransferase involved in cell wall biosynthesis